MIDFDDAVSRLASLATPLGTEQVPLAQAHGRILAGPVVAAVDAPPAAVSSMDGYAVHESDLANLPARLKVAFENAAGVADPGTLDSGECARIFTGAPVPHGADRVVMQEMVERDDNYAVIAGPLSDSRFVRNKGSDFRAGAQLLAAGKSLGPRQLVAAAAADCASLACHLRPHVHIISTGDELAEAGTARHTPGAVPESLGAGLAAFIADQGGVVTGRQRLGDELLMLERAAAAAVEGCDLVVVTGGASVGEKDFAKAMFAPLGLELVFEQVRMKPGKPVWAGAVGHTRVIGLPGNPTSAMVTARILLAPLLAGLTGRTPAETLDWQERQLAAALPANGNRESFVRACLTGDGVLPLNNQDSGAQHALAQADTLIRRPAFAPAAQTGTTVPTLRF